MSVPTDPFSPDCGSTSQKGSKIFRIPDPDPFHRIYVFLAQKNVSMLSEI